MNKPLTDLMPTLYAALDMVSREMVGFIPAVAIHAAPTTAAKGQDIRIPQTTTATAEDIVPGAPTPHGDPELDHITLTIQKSRMVPVRWSGEEQRGVSHTGIFNSLLAQQFAQAMRALTNEVDADLAGLYTKASRAHGTPGVTPFATSMADAALVRKILADNGAPLTDLHLVVDTLTGATLRSNSHLTRAHEAGSDATLRRGELLQLMGFYVRESAQIRPHIPGRVTGTALVSVDVPAGTNVLPLEGVTDVALKAGDMLHFGDGHHYVLAQSLTQSLVDADIALTLGAPGLVAPVAEGSPLTVGALSTPCMAFDRNALHLVARAPAMPTGGDEADDVTAITDPVSGISFQVAVYRGYRQVRYEVGLAWGIACIKPEHVALLVR